ncbi:MAG: mechanosensitive ion channel [Lachnospiraceae bacterium]|nr:mechanosensitive ion channel [Lachnospiraceae bacterium]
MKRLIDGLPAKLTDFAVRLLVALIVIFIASKLIRIVVNIIRKSMTRANADEGVKNFTCAFTSAALKILLALAILASFGVNTASIIALLGTAGVAIGLALQGSLSNLAGGVMILALRPFRIGDYILEDSHGHEGTVKEISLFTTKLTTYDNKVIVLPNGDLANTSLTNMTGALNRMLEVKVGVSYDTDLDRAKEVLQRVLDETPDKIEEKTATVYVDSLGDSAVILGVRCWVPNQNVLSRRWDLNERVKKALDAAHITIPFPQREVTIKQPAS